MPCIDGALDVLAASGAGKEVIAHCRAVAEVAVRICLLRPELDARLVEAGAILHDIGRAQTHDISHGVVGAGILSELGCEKEIILIAERHVGAGLTADDAAELGLPRRDYLPISPEEKVVAHSDNLVAGDTYAGIWKTLEQARERMPPHAVERLVDLHFEVFPPLTVETSTTIEFELILLEDFDALARTCNGDGGLVIEVSGFEAPQAAEKLRASSP